MEKIKSTIMISHFIILLYEIYCNDLTFIVLHVTIMLLC